jgi:hypothetical protein
MNLLLSPFFLLLDERKFYQDNCSSFRLVVGRNSACMLLDNPLDNR